MIVFDLKCEDDHVFEAWFPDSATFEKQVRRKEVACPICGNTKIVKAPMAPNISIGSGTDSKSLPKPKDGAARDMAKAMTLMRELRAEVEKNSDYVGPTFAEEARKIHYGETEKRNIHGEASSEEASELKDEGVPFSVIPWAPRTDS
ncbi:MAG: DUF1178 family protein [Alphaproteobacteria bacterium]|jgi:hypothetical protein|nr:DUF1178 family protein [Alphaproteobacteria bacterium]MDP6516755.1 DUF1178 family protein [Alphaproteobacteria bacterium]